VKRTVERYHVIGSIASRDIVNHFAVSSHSCETTRQFLSIPQWLKVHFYLFHNYHQCIISNNFQLKFFSTEANHLSAAISRCVSNIVVSMEMVCLLSSLLLLLLTLECTLIPCIVCLMLHQYVAHVPLRNTVAPPTENSPNPSPK